MKREILVPVRFADVDSAGIVYYPRFFHFFHVAMEEFFSRCLEIDYAELVSTERRGLPAVHVETDFVSPLRYGETLALRVEIVALGATSVRWRYRGREAVSRRDVVRAEVVTVYSDLDRLTKTPLPEAFRARLERALTETAGERGS